MPSNIYCLVRFLLLTEPCSLGWVPSDLRVNLSDFGLRVERIRIATPEEVKAVVRAVVEQVNVIWNPSRWPISAASGAERLGPDGVLHGKHQPELNPCKKVELSFHERPQPESATPSRSLRGVPITTLGKSLFLLHIYPTPENVQSSKI
ncbi:hypothetical protein [Bradyrhizobium sp. BR13661]|jgi:hypothetical protein|uniref:hypothetical protein n=1 Tax=Bradyrhizobium sp. BR13661 TaxID=2940622 RepID=UPI002473EEE1|nr:hypothetical protein [Bradyrhizobium sp. BR13661]